ncbi:general substrate transporter [Aspergillus sclerotiicarbonarius CBS 121057]|uniref:General substrate transporter n=1 Tax=Aspergillus sclerotiicarbonarius (strain CBS 121057 / IBT 28362) TaxID=1448318 RepID=A0A319DS29_ASPSB|nr:general substrate transporter [Aspergillus sclerotiicarbonarius CBS 121057]
MASEKDFKSSLDLKDSDARHIEVADHAPDPEALATSVNDLPITWFVWLVAFTASIAGMLFGYDTGIISGVLVVLKDDLNNRPVTSSEKEMITSLCSGGAFIGAIFAGNTADRFGRKMAIYLGCILFVIGSVLQATAYTIAQMSVGRVVVGLGVGSAAMVVPLYIAEIAPARARGRLIGLNNMSITGGQIISYAIGAAFADVSHGWRYMVGLGAVPAIILGCMMPFCPESPRHLVYNGRNEEARAVLGRIYGAAATNEQIDAQLDSIRVACDQAREINETGSGWSKIVKLHTVPSNLRALISACGLMVISQMSGFNALMYYSSTLFSLVGFDDSTAVGLVVAGTNFIMTWVNMMVVDSWGRRRLLLSTAWGMAVGFVAVAISIHFIPVNMETLEPLDPGVSGPAIAVLVFVIWFVVFYGVSVGNTAWMSTDFFPLEVRAMGTMWMTCSNWGSNVIVSSTFLTMAKSMTLSGAFGFYAALCGISYVWIYFFYPEVSGLILEEVQEVFEHGFGVNYARQLRKERKDIIEERMKSADKPIPMGH